jgi:hypothetical protein
MRRWLFAILVPFLGVTLVDIFISGAKRDPTWLVVLIVLIVPAILTALAVVGYRFGKRLDDARALKDHKEPATPLGWKGALAGITASFVFLAYTGSSTLLEGDPDRSLGGRNSITALLTRRPLSGVELLKSLACGSSRKPTSETSNLVTKLPSGVMSRRGKSPLVTNTTRSGGGRA